MEKTSEEIQNEVRKAVYAMKSEIYMKTQAAVSKRWVYESEIKRNYFHVNPLGEGQLQAWGRYLDFEESEGDIKRIKTLYMRCLVVCAHYEELWLRYVKYLIRINEIAEAETWIKKACDVFVPLPRIACKLFYALFEEVQGRIDSARTIYKELMEQVPGCPETIINYAQFERRNGDLSKAQELLLNAIENADSKLKGFFEVENEKIVQSFRKNPQKLLMAYKDICERNPECSYSHVTYFLFTLNLQKNSLEAAKEAWDLIYANQALPSQLRKDIAVKYRDFLMCNVASAEKIMAVEVCVPGDISSGEPNEQGKKRKSEEVNNTRNPKSSRTGTSAQSQPPQCQYGQSGAYNYPAGYGIMSAAAYSPFYGQPNQGSSATTVYASPTVAPTAPAQFPTWGNYQR